MEFVKNGVIQKPLAKRLTYPFYLDRFSMFFLDVLNSTLDNKEMRVVLRILLLITLTTLSACKATDGSSTTSSSPNSSPTPIPTATPVPVSHDVTISWTASKAKLVNSSGGGYRVYYGTSPGVNTASASYINVPYVSGDSAPNSVIASWISGSYYIKVVAYSSRASSGASTELKVVVP